MSQDTIQIKLLRNVMTYLGDNMPHVAPTLIIRKTTNERGDEILESDMDLSQIHHIPIQSERPEVPEREEWWDDEYFTQVKHDANTEARKHREENNVIRKRLQTFVDRGIFEIVSDPYRKKAAPVAPAPVVATKTPRKKRST